MSKTMPEVRLCMPRTGRLNVIASRFRLFLSQCCLSPMVSTEGFFHEQRPYVSHPTATPLTKTHCSCSCSGLSLAYFSSEWNSYWFPFKNQQSA